MVKHLLNMICEQYSFFKKWEFYLLKIGPFFKWPTVIRLFTSWSFENLQSPLWIYYDVYCMFYYRSICDCRLTNRMILCLSYDYRQSVSRQSIASHQSVVRTPQTTKPYVVVTNPFLWSILKVFWCQKLTKANSQDLF